MSMGIPYPPERSCEDAEGYMDSMKVLDTTIATHLEEAHRKQEVRINKKEIGSSFF